MHKFSDNGEAVPSGHHGVVFGGENMFARRGVSAEDDGWLVCFTYGDQRCPSALDIIDAQTMQRTARVAMPAKVPNGFHAMWLPGHQS